MINRSILYKLLQTVVFVCLELIRGLFTGCTILGILFASGVIFFRDNVFGSPEHFPQTVTFEDTMQLLDLQTHFVWSILLIGIVFRIMLVLFQKTQSRE